MIYNHTPGPPLALQAPVSSDKPWITIDATGKYSLVIPGVQTDTAGVDWSLGSGGKTVGFEQVYVATNASDTASTINAKLAAGRHVVLSPGVYNLTDTLAVVKSGQVLLGLGVATLISGTGKPVISVRSGIWVRDFAKHTHNAQRNRSPKYTCSEVHHA